MGCSGGGRRDCVERGGALVCHWVEDVSGSREASEEGKMLGPTTHMWTGCTYHVFVHVAVALTPATQISAYS